MPVLMRALAVHVRGVHDGAMARVDWRWPGAPPLAAGVAFTAALALSYGTAVHVVQLVAGGLDPYPNMPAWLSAYFVCLTIADPVAAVLLWRRSRLGVILGCAVLVSDALANGYANYIVVDSEVTMGRIGQAIITILAVSLCAAARWLPSAPAEHRR